MKIIMDDLRLTNINQIKSFLKGSEGYGLRLCSLTDKYRFIDRTIDRLGYHKLKRKEKRLVVSYLRKLTGYKKAQLFRLKGKIPILFINPLMLSSWRKLINCISGLTLPPPKKS